MSAAPRPAAPEPANDRVVGFVEAITSEAALGWAWQQGQDTAIVVELRCGGQTLSRAEASDFREDLARGGIGDGRHAFNLPIPPEYRNRPQELVVVAVTDDAGGIPLPAPPRPSGAPDGLSQLQRGVDMLIASQRVMHRNLQSALLQPAAKAPDVAAAQAELQQRIDTLELFLIRVEAALAAQQRTPDPVASRSTAFVIAGVAGVALLTSAASLVLMLVGS